VSKRGCGLGIDNSENVAGRNSSDDEAIAVDGDDAVFLVENRELLRHRVLDAGREKGDAHPRVYYLPREHCLIGSPLKLL